jgi:hypothetical protein
MANAYANYQGENLAFVFTRAGKVLFPYKHPKFPFIIVRSGDAVPQGSLLKRRGARKGIASDVSECVPDLWINVERGRCAPRLYEQVLGQSDDLAIVMLWLEPADEDEDNEWENLTSRERYRKHISVKE